MTNEWQEKLKKFQEARKAKSAWYEKTAREILEEHQIKACYKCDCRGWGRETKHSRAHAHTKKRIVCLDAVPKGYKSFFTLLHEVGHIVAEKADYSSGVAVRVQRRFSYAFPSESTTLHANGTCRACINTRALRKNQFTCARKA